MAHNRISWFGGENWARLSQQDQESLVGLEKKLQVVRDRVAGVAKGYHTGCAITGRGGTCKSWTVMHTLKELDVHHRLHNSHMTARGLFDAFARAPSAVHVVEDAERVLRDPLSLGILRSATWSSHDHEQTERLITWHVHGAAPDIPFKGGIILINNRQLSDLPEARALATRLSLVDLDVSDQEIAALMRQVALQGYRLHASILAPDECLEVAEYIIAESPQLNRPLDMRLLVNAFADRLQADDHDAGCTWQDLVASRLRGQPVVKEAIASAGIRRQMKIQELAIAREVAGLPPQERLKIWKEKTGRSQATLYRRLGELGQNDARDLGMY
ncbi:MAG: hypothetical protein ABFD16_22125 [Thermoguttaceae bacterium]|jgi:hypothetical protein